MKALVVISDSEAMAVFERFLLAGDRGFTVLPAMVGRGRTGLKSGDRVHPGSSSLLLTMVPDGEVEEALALLRAARDEARAREATRMFVMPVEEVGD